MGQLVHTEIAPSRWETEPGGSGPNWELVVLGLLLLGLYSSVLGHLLAQWWHDPNFSHGFFVPLFSVFVVWQERARLSRLTPKPSWSGLGIVAFGMCTLLLGQMGAENFLARTSLIIVLAGLIVLFYGWIIFRALLFPWGFLFLMVPLPVIVLNQITFPLQLLASRLSAAILPIFGVPILREGNVIILPSRTLEVAEACSGIRSLMSLITLSIIYGYLLEKRLWVRYLLAIAAIPIAVAANSVRIIGTGLLVQYWTPEMADGYYHTFEGWLIFVISLVMLYGLHALIGLIWPERSEKS